MKKAIKIPHYYPAEAPNANFKLGLFDSANGHSVIAYKMVDATELCTEAQRCIIKYADVTAGRIAQINQCDKGKWHGGVWVHYFITEMTKKELAADEVFQRRMQIMGADPTRMANLIYDNQ